MKAIIEGIVIIIMAVIVVTIVIKTYEYFQGD